MVKAKINFAQKLHSDNQGLSVEDIKEFTNQAFSNTDQPTNLHTQQLEAKIAAKVDKLTGRLKSMNHCNSIRKGLS